MPSVNIALRVLGIFSSGCRTDAAPKDPQFESDGCGNCIAKGRAPARFKSSCPDLISHKPIVVFDGGLFAGHHGRFPAQAEFKRRPVL